MFVIARQSSYTYQGKTVDIRKVGEELGVRYALEGSVRRLGDELRVNAQLISTETGAHLWAERFDRPLLDLSAATLADGEDDIIRHIASALNVKMVDVESARSLRERPGNADATDLVLRARSLSNQPPSRERTAEAGELYEQALKRDPSSVSAMVGIAGILINQSQGYLGQWAAADALERAGKLMSEAARHRIVFRAGSRRVGASARSAASVGGDMIPAAAALDRGFSEPGRRAHELLATAKTIHRQALPTRAFSMRSPFGSIRVIQTCSTATLSWASRWFSWHAGERSGRFGLERSLAANPEAVAPDPQRPIPSACHGAYAMSGQPDDAHRAVDEGNQICGRSARCA